MKVYAEIEEVLGIGLHRVQYEIQHYSPPGIEFVDSIEEADLQIVPVIGLGSLEFIKHPNHILLQYCYMTAERQDPEFWLPIFQKAKMVFSYYNLPSYVGSNDFNFLHSPLGVDMEVFQDRKLSIVPRDFIVATSGYEPFGEAIKECYQAARILKKKVFHLGPGLDHDRFQPWVGAGFVAHSGISDTDLARMYSRSKYVSGLRFGEGFELPVIEGLACGARPICFDLPVYRQWFNDFAVFVPHIRDDDLMYALVEIFNTDRPVTEEELQICKERFSWEVVMQKFWERVLG